ncbi:MAG: DUF3306 domain-containing protein [Gammaproteobacteria bacterium]|nr:DUF3306 domain-containing protein [Gammaproteobacteria bacterium]
MARRPPKAPENTEPSGDEGVLQRWARRKSESQLEAEPAPPAEPLTAEPSAELPGEPDKTDADMPPIESIHEDSDVSDFFSPGVSDKLRQSALKKLFRSAKFNIVDGLDDYDDDFTTYEALGDIITSDMRHQMELIQERAEAALAAGEAQTGEEAAASQAAGTGTDTATATDTDTETDPGSGTESISSADPAPEPAPVDGDGDSDGERT